MSVPCQYQNPAWFQCSQTVNKACGPRVCQKNKFNFQIELDMNNFKNTNIERYELIAGSSN